MDKKTCGTYTQWSATQSLKNTFESVLMRWMKLELIIRSEVSQKEKYQYSILTHMYVIYKDLVVGRECVSIIPKGELVMQDGLGAT